MWEYLCTFSGWGGLSSKYTNIFAEDLFWCVFGGPYISVRGRVAPGVKYNKI